MKQVDIDQIIKAQDELKAYAEKTLAVMKPIDYSVTRHGDFVDIRANALFDAWCNSETSRTLIGFFDFLASSNW